MRYEYIEPFVNSTIGVLGSVIRSNIERGEISLVQGDKQTGDIAIAVWLFGDSEGHVVLHMNTATAVNICARLNETDVESLTPFGIDSLSELANMIAGNAVSALNDQGFDFTVSPPRVVTGENTAEKTAELEAFRIPLTTDCGEVSVQVSLKAH